MVPLLSPVRHARRLSFLARMRRRVGERALNQGQRCKLNLSGLHLGGSRGGAATFAPGARARWKRTALPAQTSRGIGTAAPRLTEARQERVAPNPPSFRAQL